MVEADQPGGITQSNKDSIDAVVTEKAHRCAFESSPSPNDPLLTCTHRSAGTEYVPYFMRTMRLVAAKLLVTMRHK